MKKGIITLTLLIQIVLLSCRTERHDYEYRIRNTTTQDSALIVTVKTLNGVDSFRLGKEEQRLLAVRSRVAGDDIWDIETSTQLYPIQGLTVASFDSLTLSEELSYRKHWSAPYEMDDKGIYTLSVTDEHLALSQKKGYRYVVENRLSDTLNIISYRTGSAHRGLDTLLPKTSLCIQIADIYLFDPSFNGSEKQATQQLSGLSSVTLLSGNRRKNINLKKEKALFTANNDSCLLVIDDNTFNLDLNK